MPIQSSGAGGAGGSVVSAQVTDGSSASLALVFNAVDVTQILIQVSPATIAPSASSTVMATVRDAYDNLVANQLVNFTLPGLASDYSDETTIPPGLTSPYGTASSCSSAN
ncbi:MAG: hypothetical protein QM661_14525 [Solimonas sp.]